MGAPFGAAILGSVLIATYQGQVQVAGLPRSVADAVMASVFAGLTAAQQAGLETLADSVRLSFVAGMADSLRVASAIAIAGAALALMFLPSRMRAAHAPEAAARLEPERAPSRLARGRRIQPLRAGS